MTFLTQMIRFGKDSVCSNSSKKTIGTSLKRKKRISIGFQQQILHRKKSKKPVKVTGFCSAENNNTSKKHWSIRDAFNSIIDALRKFRKQKERTTFGFMPQRLSNHQKDKTRKKIGYINNDIEVIRKRQQMANGNNERETIGFFTQRLKNYHSTREIIRSLWENIKIIYKVAAKKAPTRDSIGFVSQKLDIHLGDKNIPHAGFNK